LGRRKSEKTPSREVRREPHLGQGMAVCKGGSGLVVEWAGGVKKKKISGGGEKKHENFPPEQPR